MLLCDYLDRPPASNKIFVTQFAKWMLSKGQGTTMTTYDSLLLAFDMDCRIDEAERLWNMILHIHTRSTSKKLFSRMISLYDHHNMSDKVIEVNPSGSSLPLLLRGTDFVTSSFLSCIMVFYEIVQT